MRLKLSFCFEGAGAVELISEIMTGFAFLGELFQDEL